MSPKTKISTCSYCQARVIISITPGSRHELICTACGAHLEHTEFLEPPSAPTPEPTVQPVPKSVFSLPGRTDEKKSSSKSYSKSKKKDRRKKQKKKKRRGLVYWIREAIDEIEDLFD